MSRSARGRVNAGLAQGLGSETWIHNEGRQRAGEDPSQALEGPILQKDPVTCLTATRGRKQTQVF